MVRSFIQNLKHARLCILNSDLTIPYDIIFPFVLAIKIFFNAMARRFHGRKIFLQLETEFTAFPRATPSNALPYLVSPVRRLQSPFITDHKL
jgi:hypothetical protein